jgi:hypothetical protein
MRRAALALLVLGAACRHAPEARPAAPPPEPPIERTAARPAADEDMQVEGALGSLADDEIAEPFKAAWPKVTQCFTQGRARLRYLGGKAEVKVRVGEEGQVASAWLVGSSVGNVATERCLLGVVRGLVFARPHGGKEAEFVYPIELRGTQRVDTWDEARLSPTVAKNKKDVAECKLRAPGGLPPQMTTTVYVAPGGRITSVGFAADGPLADELLVCLAERMQKWRADDPLGRIVKATVAVFD